MLQEETNNKEMKYRLTFHEFYNKVLRSYLNEKCATSANLFDALKSETSYFLHLLLLRGNEG